MVVTFFLLIKVSLNQTNSEILPHTHTHTHTHTHEHTHTHTHTHTHIDTYTNSAKKGKFVLKNEKRLWMKDK